MERKPPFIDFALQRCQKRPLGPEKSSNWRTWLERRKTETAVDLTSIQRKTPIMKFHTKKNAYHEIPYKQNAYLNWSKRSKMNEQILLKIWRCAIWLIHLVGFYSLLIQDWSFKIQYLPNKSIMGSWNKKLITKAYFGVFYIILLSVTLLLHYMLDYSKKHAGADPEASPSPSGARPPHHPKGPSYDIQFWPTDPKYFLKVSWAPVYTNF